MSDKTVILRIPLRLGNADDLGYSPERLLGPPVREGHGEGFGWVVALETEETPAVDQNLGEKVNNGARSATQRFVEAPMPSLLLCTYPSDLSDQE